VTGASLPTLSARDLEAELEELHRAPRRSLTTAFHGAPTAGLESVTATVCGEPVRFRVSHATCELALRQALSGAQEQDAPLVLLVDFDGRLPLDVTGRLASGKVRHVTEERRLARLFGARAVSPEVLASPLKDALMAEGGDFGALPGATLDLDTAWRRYLARRTELPADAALSEERVVAHCAVAGDARALGRVLAARPALESALHTYLAERAGPVARLAWRAWTRGRGADVAAFAFVLQGAVEAVERSEYLEAWLGLRLAELDPELQGVLGRRDGGAGRALLRRWGALADGLALRLGEGVEPIVRAADRLVAGDERVAAALAASPHLECALDGAREALARALERALAVPASEAVREVRAALARLEAHHLCRREPYRSQLVRARMAARLVAYLVAYAAELAGGAAGGEAGAGAGMLPGDEMAGLAAEYARHGGFVDLARSRARGPRADRLDSACAAVVARADELRDRQDERFARALPHWLRRRKVDRVVPVDLALERFAVEFLAGHDHRRLLVLLMDGMAWASAVELLLDLENERHGPVRWQPRGAGSELLPPMLAALPSLTHVSRSALFAGKPIAPGERGDTSRDPDRFDGHPGLRKLLGHGPTLLLRTRAEERPGHASAEALALIESDARVVGLVINAVDDSLDGGPGLDVAFTHRTIKALPDVLAAAGTARRAVLLLADHGHVLADRFGPPLPGENRLGARCRELDADEQPGPGEVVIEGELGWRKSARRRLAVLFRETDTYSGMTGRGAHGGASMAEVVAPAVLIASESLVRSVGVHDPELDLRPFPRPRWWDIDVAEAAAAAEPAAVSTVAATRRARSSPQLALPVVVPAEPAPVVVTAAPVAPPAQPAPASRWATLLRASEEYQTAAKRERDYWEQKILPAIDLLAEHGGMLPAVQFAARVGELPFRVGGLVAALAERLNLEQHPVITHDARAGQVRLDRALLEQLFRG
jgi:PglZ domain